MPSDDKGGDIVQLEALLQRAAADKRLLIERELSMRSAGLKGERKAAYLIDFHLIDSTKTAIIHDLGLELADGRGRADRSPVHSQYVPVFLF